MMQTFSRLVAACGLVATFGLLAACSFIVDFDESDLPCPCDTDHVCLVSSNRCVARNSVELFKSCDQNTSPPGGDDLCPVGAICRAINDRGPRCLPECTPVEYATVDSGATIARACPLLTTCWPLGGAQGGVGVCSEGVCGENPNTCEGAREQCVSFNGAGVCFSTCELTEADSCGPGLVCTVIGQGPVTACVNAGILGRGELCSSTDLCEKSDEDGRTLMCGRPQVASNPPLRCLPICFSNSDCPEPRRQCDLAITNIDPFTGTDLGVCAIE